MRGFDDSLLSDVRADTSDWFDLSADVGRGFATARQDAIKLEAILANAGDHDLAATDGPTGYWGTALDAALRGYQKRNDLAVDGWARPDGPTIRHMRDALGGKLGAFEAPSPDEVDAHHEALDAGRGPLLTAAPQTKLGAWPGLPDIGKAGRGSNASQIDWLARNRIGFDGVPEQLARYASELGPEGIAQARDFVTQFAAANPQDADALTAGLLAHLPDDAARSRFLGRDPVFGRPAGVRLPRGDLRPEMRTAEMRCEDERDPRETNRNLLLRNDAPVEMMLASERQDEAAPHSADEKAPPQVAQSPDTDWYKEIPAYRADVFRSQPDVWNTVRDTVLKNPEMGEGQRAAILSIVAAEGGMRKDPDSDAVAGITPNFIARSRADGSWPAELGHVKSPSDLKPADVPRAVQHYFDSNLAKIGGAKALDSIPDSRVAAAVADTLYRDGPGRGAELVQKAINMTNGVDGKPDGIFGSGTLEAVRGFAGDAGKAADFLKNLEEFRSDLHAGDKVRNGQFRIR